MLQPFDPFPAILATMAPPPPPPVTTDPGLNELVVRVVLKRELRAAGVPFMDTDSTLALSTLQELHHRAILTGCIY